MGRCRGRCGSRGCPGGAACLEGNRRGMSIGRAVRGAAAASDKAGCRAQLVCVQAAGTATQQSFTGAAGVKLPHQCGPGSSRRQSPDHHGVAAARAVLRQPVLSDGAIEPQPLRLQHAAVPCVPGCDAQLRTGDTAGMQQLPAARWEGARSWQRPCQPVLPCACPGWGRLRRGTGRSLSPMWGTSKQRMGEE